jgi:hypothetical protein
MVWPIIDSQRMYNDLRHQIAKTVSMVANPTWFVDPASGITPEMFTNETGGLIYANGSLVPQQGRLESMPNYVMDHQQRIVSDMQSTIGIFSTQLGQRAVGVESGKHVQSLAQQGSSQLGLTQTNIIEGFARHAKCLLGIMQRRFTRKRTESLFDEHGRIIHQTLKSTDIVKDAEVFIEADSFFRAGAIDRERRIRNDVQLQLIDPQTAKDQLRLRDFGRPAFQKTLGLLHARQLLEGVLSNQGNPDASAWTTIEVWAIDDIDSIVDVFMEYVRTPQYYDLDEALQDYIRDIIVTLTTFGQGDQAYQAAQQQQQAYPHVASQQTGAPVAPSAALPSPNAPAGQGPRSPASMPDEEALSHGAEAPMTTSYGGAL